MPPERLSRSSTYGYPPAPGVALEPEVLGVGQRGDEAPRDRARRRPRTRRTVALRVEVRRSTSRRRDRASTRLPVAVERAVTRPERLVHALAGDRDLDRRDEPEPGGIRERRGRVVGDRRERAAHRERLAARVREVEASFERSAESSLGGAVGATRRGARRGPRPPRPRGNVMRFEPPVAEQLRRATTGVSNGSESNSVAPAATVDDAAPRCVPSGPARRARRDTSRARGPQEERRRRVLRAAATAFPAASTTERTRAYGSARICRRPAQGGGRGRRGRRRGAVRDAAAAAGRPRRRPSAERPTCGRGRPPGGRERRGRAPPRRPREQARLDAAALRRGKRRRAGVRADAHDLGAARPSDAAVSPGGRSDSGGRAVPPASRSTATSRSTISRQLAGPVSRAASRASAR